MFCIILLVLVPFTNYTSATLMLKDSHNYGPYIIEWKSFDTCHGPKSVNLTRYTTDLIVDGNNMYKGLINITFLDQMLIEEVKMSVFTIKEKRKTLLWNYIVDKPCQHFVLAAVLETYVGARNCVVKKGTYNCNMDFTEIVHDYLGTSFFYGEYLFKALVLSKKGNIICLIFSPIIKRKE